MTHATTHAFALPDHLADKADPALVADDERHFAAIADSLDRSIAVLSERLDAERRAAGGTGQAAMDRDLEVHRLTARLRTLRRYTLDLCLGKMVGTDGETVYVGRLGLTDRGDQRLLVDWRSPAAEPFFGATHANPMRLASRRRYRWTNGRIIDYWDEVFVAGQLDGHRAALDDQSAFIASLGSSRSPRMRDVLGTIQADQDAIIRAGSRGALVVDGGPGTGKTVVALHRAAYLLYAEPRLGHRRCGVLFVGPHEPYLAYVADVLPSLGEEGVRTCTLRDLVPGAEDFPEEQDPDVARLKSTAAMVGAIEPAVRLYEEPPTEGMVVESHWSDVWLSASDWAEAFEAPDPGTPHCCPSSSTSTRPTTTSPRTWCGGHWRSTRSSGRRSARPGPCSSRPTSSGTSGRSRPTSGCARPGSPQTTYDGCSAPTRVPGRPPTSRCSTPRGSGSATRRRRAGGHVSRQRRPPSANGWTR